MNLRYLDKLFEILMSPTGAVLLFLVVIIMIASFISERVNWILLGGTLWITTFGYVVNEWFDITLWAPLQFLRMNARQLSIMGLLLIFCLLLIRLKWTHLSSGILSWLFFQLCWAGDLLIGGDYEKGVLGGIVIVLLCIVLCVEFGGCLLEEKAHSAIRTVLLTFVICFLGGILIQFLVNLGAMTPGGGRFMGTSDNAQACGWTLSTCCLILLFLWYSWDQKKLALKVLLLSLGLFALLFLLWTGSRTAWLTIIVSVSCFFRHRLGSLIFGFVPVVGFFVAYLVLFSSSDAMSVISTRNLTADTRSMVWLDLWNTFMKNPLIGSRYIVGGESSYLTIAASMGVVGLSILGLAFFCGLKNLFYVWKGYHLLDSRDKAMYDYVFAGLVSMSVCAMLDGFLLALLTVYAVFPWIYLTLLNYLMRRVSELSEEEYNLGSEVLEENDPYHVLEAFGDYPVSR